MKRLCHKRIAALFLCLPLLAAFPLRASAHDSAGSIEYGANTTCWVIDPNAPHAGTLSITYRYSSVDETYRARIKTEVEAAADIWQAYSSGAHANNLYRDLDGSRTYLSIAEASGTAMVNIWWGNYGTKIYDFLAEVDWTGCSKNSSNHLISGAKLKINTGLIFNGSYGHHADHPIAHEFGHIFGLKDLDPDRVNVTHYQLMGYGWFGGSTLPNLPTLSDKRGACVILGLHEWNEHTFAYSNITSTKHSRECTLCKGYNLNPAHSYEVISMNPYIQRCACGHMISQ